MFLENLAFLIPHGVETNKKYVIIYFIMWYIIKTQICVEIFCPD